MTFIELCKELNVPYRLPGQHHHCTPGFVNVDCFDCSPGWGSFRLGYNERKRYMTCWHCGYKTIFQFLASARADVNKSQLWQQVKHLCSDKVIDHIKTYGKYTPPGTGDFLPRYKVIWDYIESRNFDPQDLRRLWKVRAIGPHHNLSWRLLIPVLFGGREVSWTTRAVSPDNPQRYVSAKPEEEIYPHKHLLYGEDYVRTTAIVCEGPTDVWKIGPGAVATFGTSFTREQVLKLSQIPNRVICYDNDYSAQKQADKLCSLLGSFPGTTTKVTLETGTDPGDADPGEIAELKDKFLGS